VLKFIRRNASAAWVKFIFIAIVVVFVFWGMGGLVGERKAQFVARVNQDAIAPADFYRAYNNLLRLYQDIYKDSFKPELMKALDLKGKALDQLIRVHLMRQEARRLGLNVSDAEVREAIARVPAFQQNGTFSKELYLRVLRANRLTPSDFEESKEEELLVDKLQNLVLGGVHVSEAEVHDRYRLDSEQLNLRFLKFDTATFAPQVELTDQDLQAYFDKNRETFREPEKIRIEYVLYEADKFAGQAQVSDAEVKGYYDERAAEYEKPEEVHARHVLFRLAPEPTADEKAKVRTRAEEVLAQLKAGADFATLAKQDSEDASAAQGGDLGSFPRGKMVPPFEQAAFSLAPGEISDLVESEFGFHIIKVEGKEPARTQTLDEVRPQVIAALTQEKAHALASDRADAARARVVGGETLGAVAEADGLSVASPPPFAQNDMISGIGRNADVTKAAFGAAAGDVGPVIDTPTGFVLFRVAERLPSHVPELATIRDRVEIAARNERAAALAKSTAEDVLAELQKNPDLDAAAKAHKVTIEETGAFPRSATSVPKIGASPDLKKEAFQLTPEKPVAPAVYPVLGGSVVAVLKERIPADEEKFNSEKDTLMKQAEDRAKSEVIEQFFNALIARASIERNDDFLAAVADTGHELDAGGSGRR
jgi:peptidyl-prolyl cis-trans isomerase D